MKKKSNLIKANRNEYLRRISRIEAQEKAKNEMMYVALGDQDLYKIKQKSRKRWFNKKLKQATKMW